MSQEQNIPTISPNTAIQYLHMFDKSKATRFRGMYMEGQPGVGKSSVAEQYTRERALRWADEWEKASRIEDAKNLREMAKDVYKSKLLIPLILNNRNPSDVSGMQFIDQETKSTVSFRPDWFPPESMRDYPVVVFLDELTTVDSLLQAPAYSVLQERRIDQYDLGDSVQIIAAGNGPEDGAISHELSTAIRDRLWLFRVSVTASEWIKDFAEPNRLHPAVIATLQTDGSMLNTNKERVEQDLMAASTQRGFTDVSALLYTFDSERAAGRATKVEDRKNMIVSRLGMRVGSFVNGVYESSMFMCNVPEILDHKSLKHVEDTLLPKDSQDNEYYPQQMIMLHRAMAHEITEARMNRILDVFLLMWERKKNRDILTSCGEIVMAAANSPDRKDGQQLMNAMLKHKKFMEYFDERDRMKKR